MQVKFTKDFYDNNGRLLHRSGVTAILGDASGARAVEAGFAVEVGSTKLTTSKEKRAPKDKMLRRARTK